MHPQTLQNQVIAFEDGNCGRRFFNIMDCIEYHHKKYWLLFALDHKQIGSWKTDWKVLEDFDAGLLFDTMSATVSLVEDEELLDELVHLFWDTQSQNATRFLN